MILAQELVDPDTGPVLSAALIAAIERDDIGLDSRAVLGERQPVGCVKSPQSTRAPGPPFGSS